MDVTRVDPVGHEELRVGGWTVLRGAIAESFVVEARAWLNAIVSAQPIPAVLEPDFEVTAEDSAPAVRRLRRLLWFAPDFWGRWLDASGMSTSIRDVVGDPAAIVFHAAFLKPGRFGSEVRAHQDQVFWESRYPRTFTWWVALDHANRSNGCLELFPATYHTGLLPHHDVSDYRWHRVLTDRQQDLGPAVPVELSPGDIVVFDSHIVHRSSPNLSTTPRRALSLVAVRTDAPNFAAADRFDLQEGAC